MEKNNLELSIRLSTLTIFRNLLKDPVIKSLQELLTLADEGKNMQHNVSAYSKCVAYLYETGPNLSQYILELVLNDENFYIKKKAAGKKISSTVENCLDAELALLQMLVGLKSDTIKKALNYHEFLPAWENSDCDIVGEYKKRLADLPHHGFGIFAKYHTFTLKGSKIVPIKYPDSQQIDQLFGYEPEREKILKNTLALIDEKGCNNMLLYGDAGTGKSSTIKAIANELGNQGLRLIEVKKNQLYQIPDIVEELSASPLKFILFIDDLSFTNNDDNFSALKAILEGSVSTGGDNIVIYATSNRRHLVKETMSDRTGNELHVNDTLQETMSLASRFGLTITFQKPDKEEYLYIVDKLAIKYGVELDNNKLHIKAEAHAIRNNGRSPRVAKQFIELLKSGI